MRKDGDSFREHCRNRAEHRQAEDRGRPVCKGHADGLRVCNPAGNLQVDTRDCNAYDRQPGHPGSYAGGDDGRDRSRGCHRQEVRISSYR